MIAAGVPAGAYSATQKTLLNPGKPLSETVGTLGRFGERFSLVTANGRRRPALMKPIDEVSPVTQTGTCPPKTSAVAGPPPL